MAKNYTTCTMHAVSLSNLMDFSFTRKLSRNFHEIFAKTKIFAKRNFAKIVPFSHNFRILAKIEKCIFVSTLLGLAREKISVFGKDFKRQYLNYKMHL
jgi:hypothetical protein